VAQVVPAFWALDMYLNQRRHYPSISWITSFSKCKSLDEELDCIEYKYTELRSEMLKILEEEIQIYELLVPIVGKDSLSEHDKIVLHIGKMIREDFLQQNMFTLYDRFCPFYKTTAMMDVFVHLYKQAIRAVTVNKNLNWATIYSKITDLLYRITSMKFEDPKEKGRDEFRMFCDDIKYEITIQFKQFNYLET